MSDWLDELLHDPARLEAEKLVDGAKLSDLFDEVNKDIDELLKVIDELVKSREEE